MKNWPEMIINSAERVPCKNFTVRTIFSGNEITAYRDPACIFAAGKYHLFMTVSEKREHRLHNRIGMSESTDLINWSKVRYLTRDDLSLNFSSPGNILLKEKAIYQMAIPAVYKRSKELLTSTS